MQTLFLREAEKLLSKTKWLKIIKIWYLGQFLGKLSQAKNFSVIPNKSIHQLLATEKHKSLLIWTQYANFTKLVKKSLPSLKNSIFLKNTFNLNLPTNVDFHKHGFRLLNLNTISMRNYLKHLTFHLY